MRARHFGNHWTGLNRGSEGKSIFKMSHNNQGCHLHGTYMRGIVVLCALLCNNKYFYGYSNPVRQYYLHYTDEGNKAPEVKKLTSSHNSQAGWGLIGRRSSFYPRPLKPTLWLLSKSRCLDTNHRIPSNVQSVDGEWSNV